MPAKEEEEEEEEDEDEEEEEEEVLYNCTSKAKPPDLTTVSA